MDGIPLNHKLTHSIMSEITHCNQCVAPMSDKETNAESVDQDCLCIKCREAVARNREEEAVASFCGQLRAPVADWFMKIVDCSDFEFARRLPSDTNETAKVLFYKSGKLQLQCHTSLNRITLTQPCAGFPSQPDWMIDFHCPTPISVILAAIKAATAKA
jgi:hypothetical protein